MKSKSIYPYPIIGDVIDFPKFNFSGDVITYSKDSENYNLEIKYELDEPTLIALITKKDVAFVTSVTNSSLYRDSFKHFNPKETHKIKIPINLIRGKDFKLNLSFKLCSNKNFDYKNPNSDKIFKDISFQMEAGQLLGHNEEGDIDIVLEQGFANFHNSNSFLRIRKGDDLTATNIQVDRDLVSVYLTSENHQLFEDAQKNRVKSLLSLIVLPVVIELVHRIKKEPDVYSEKNYLWVGVLKEKFGDDPPFDDEDDCLVIAEKILGDPWFDALQEINVLSDIANQND